MGLAQEQDLCLMRERNGQVAQETARGLLITHHERRLPGRLAAKEIHRSAAVDCLSVGLDPDLFPVLGHVGFPIDRHPEALDAPFALGVKKHVVIAFARDPVPASVPVASGRIVARHRARDPSRVESHQVFQDRRDGLLISMIWGRSPSGLHRKPGQKHHSPAKPLKLFAHLLIPRSLRMR